LSTFTAASEAWPQANNAVNDQKQLFLAIDRAMTNAPLE
jgi:hypothetical protein